MIILNDLRAIRDILPEGTVPYGPMAKPEIRASLCPRAKQSRIALKPEILFYRMFLYNIKIHRRTSEMSVVFLIYPL